MRTPFLTSPLPHLHVDQATNCAVCVRWSDEDTFPDKAPNDIPLHIRMYKLVTCYIKDC